MHLRRRVKCESKFCRTSRHKTPTNAAQSFLIASAVSFAAVFSFGQKTPKESANQIQYEK
jgi:hypothetical protein